MSTRYIWPEGCSWAFALTIDVDAETPMLWRLRGSGTVPTGEREYRRFGLRQGVDRLLEMLEQLDMSATFFVPAYVAEHNPEVVPAIASLGHEVGLHGYIHENVEELDEAANREVLRKSIGILGEQLRKRPVGYRSPSWSMTEFLPDLLQAHSVTYDSSLMGYEHPYTFHGLTELPVSWTADDATYFFYLGRGDDIGPPWPAGLIEQAWREEITAARRFSNLMCLTVHPWIVGRGHRIQPLERLLREVKADASVFRRTCREIAEYHRQSPNRDRYVVGEEPAALKRS
jgi:peptidoglycan/xylan/chitin deacetylase (PgdA/CDA1 family)